MSQKSNILTRDSASKGITTTNHHPQQKPDAWPVVVFRFSESQGWELYQEAVPILEEVVNQQTKTVPQVTPNRGSSLHQSMEHPTRHHPKETIPMMAAPRVGSIEVKKLRLRVHLFTPPSQKGHDNWDNVHTTIVRRRDMVLLSPRTGLGAVVLKFKSITECEAFTDRLLELNAENVRLHEKSKKEEQSRKRRRLKGIDDEFHRGKDKLHEESETTEGKECESGDAEKIEGINEQSERKALIQSYLIRLLHDKDFLDFVDGVEENLLSTSDCTEILDALEYPRVQSIQST